MSDAETNPEIVETPPEDSEPLLKTTKKEKKARTEKQLAAFEKARLKRIENIKAKNMAKKERELQEYKATIEPPTIEAEEGELIPNNPEFDSPIKVNKPKPKAKPKKVIKKIETPPPSEEDSGSSSSEEEYIIRKRKPTRNKRKTPIEKEELARAVETEQDRYFQNIIFV